MTIVRCGPQGDRWRVQFAEVTDRQGAESVARLELRAEPLTDPDALWVHELVGAEVRLSDGTAVGRVTEVESNPASDLLVLDSGVLVPLVFVLSAGDGIVTIDPPVGLLELNQPDPEKTEKPDSAHKAE
jgi:16S rRNA processing protein RimM